MFKNVNQSLINQVSASLFSRVSFVTVAYESPFSWLLVHTMRAGIVIGDVCLSVCVSVRPRKISKTSHQKLMKLEPWWTLDVGRWHLTLTFDLESYFCTTLTFEWLDLATSFLVWRCTLRISVSRSSFKVIGPRSRSWQLKAVVHRFVPPQTHLNLYIVLLLLIYIYTFF